MWAAGFSGIQDGGWEQLGLARQTQGLLGMLESQDIPFILSPDSVHGVRDPSKVLARWK